ncbi:uncharacterized protein EV420DRAFT_1472690 [Desarmillaria tabescens]|uniref:Uncharacterized protein n=1 Tax=Armillaria tabescens TaxID=1929756 RepID=A0AA39NQ35_ARMTA|nr:uncharacterized protein EV420DRAFT_1472690 [Desarmillaria tabescens]KAK0469463.1 hypothetical protein EV420DRAFT_1472690 [Desarmillaria tabescens]
MEQPSATKQWLMTEELVHAAMSIANITELARWASVSTRICSIVKGILQTRMKKQIDKFIPHSDLLAFFVLLDKTDSAVGGSVALAVLTPKCNWEPRDLNIVVPQHAADRWTDFFGYHGYDGGEICLHEYGTREHPRYPILHTVVAKTVFLFTHPMLKQDIVIIVSNSDTCMTPIIRAQTTSQMNAITSSHVYCLYPSLTAQKIALRGYYPHPSDKYFLTALLTNHHDQLKKQALTYYESSAGTGQKCGLACADIERTLHGWRGVGVIQWGGYMDSKRSETSLLPSNTLHVAWQLGEWCDNVLCDMARSIVVPSIPPVL